MAVGAISLAVFFTLAVTGNATVATLVITEGLAMGIVIAIWVRAWQEGQPGSGLFLAAISLSILAASLKAAGVQFTLGGWEFDPNSIYHMAQMPGLCLLLYATLLRSDNVQQAIAWRDRGVASTA
ncbi:MAG: hypothetical protein CL732_08205 [Chloroflexi bacterium]|nr:hypothetical protein [Chloroflexota bacterium]